MIHCPAVLLASTGGDAKIDYDHTCDKAEQHNAPHHCFCGKEW